MSPAQGGFVLGPVISRPSADSSVGLRPRRTGELPVPDAETLRAARRANQAQQSPALTET